MEHCFKRAEISSVPKRRAIHVKAHLVVFRTRAIANWCITIDKAPNQPDTCKPIDMRMSSGDPSSALVGRNRCGGHSRVCGRSSHCCSKLLQTDSQLMAFRTIEVVDASGLGKAPTQALNPVAHCSTAF